MPQQPHLSFKSVIFAPRATPKRIALFGLFGSGNLGNDGSLEAMLGFLRIARPDAELTCICADPDKVREAFHLPTMRIGWQNPPGRRPLVLGRFFVTRKLLQLGHAIRHVRKFDALVVPGTGILDDYSERPWGFPASLFSWCAAARLFGTRVVFVSVGAGPIQHPVSRWLMKSAARMAHYRSYRDTLSKDFMHNIGFSGATRDPVYPDIAFKLPNPRSADLPRCSEARASTIGLGVMTYYGWRGDANRGAHIYHAYIAKISRFVMWLLDRGHRVRILMGEATDLQAINDVSAIVSRERPDLPPDRLVAEPVTSLHELMRQIAETDIVVATRFHNVVCALKLGKATISLGYARKNDVLMAEMGVGEFCQQIERLDIDLLIEQFVKLLAGRSLYERRIREMNLAYEERLRVQDAQLTAALP